MARLKAQIPQILVRSRELAPLPSHSPISSTSSSISLDQFMGLCDRYEPDKKDLLFFFFS